MLNSTPAIIVVEDEPIVMIVLRRVLHDLQLDHDIIAVDNGRSALAQAAYHRCALLITDYKLFGLDGLDLAREFKTRYNSHVIMITGYINRELQQAAQAIQIEYLIEKPFRVDAFEATVRTMLHPTPTTPPILAPI